jgi:hypothetical protein
MKQDLSDYRNHLLVAALLISAPLVIQAQGRAGGGIGGGGQAVASAQAAAPIDLTGYWVALITDNWTYRVITPPKGDYLYLPINQDARRVADTWDPAKDEAAGEQCKGYGPVGVMRMPTRLHITWQDERTLKLETDTGMQTRILRFGAADAVTGSPTWQGVSNAEWQVPGGGRGRGGQGGQQTRGGSLKVTTTQMRPGYVHKNGIPYSENAVLTEYFTTISDRGITYLVDTLMLEDPKYLTQSLVRSAQFKKQADATGWDPTPCSAK